MAATIEEIIVFLGKVPLFNGLDNNQLKRLAKGIRERDYEAGEVILEQGKQGVGLFIMVRGEAKVERQQVDGHTIELDRLHRTDIFGELSLLDDSSRTASIIAVDAVKCLALDKQLFLAEITSDAEMAVALLKTLAGRYRRLIQNM